MDTKIQIKQIDNYKVEVYVIQTTKFTASLKHVSNKDSWYSQQGYDEIFCSFSGYAHAHHRRRNEWDYIDIRKKTVLNSNVSTPLKNEQLIISDAIPESIYYKMGLNNSDVQINWIN